MIQALMVRRQSRGPNLWSGLNSLDDADTAVYFARREAWERIAAETGHAPLMPGRLERDRDAVGFYDVPSRDVARREALLDDFEAAHEARHWFYDEPFCRACSCDPLDGLSMARIRLSRWMTLNPGRMPRDEWDGATLPGSATGASMRSPFYTLRDLDALPDPEWLVAGMLPQGGAGVISGRDGSGKTFLAVDLAVEVAAWPATSEWHGRQVEPGGWGRVLLLEGEGVHSIGRRVDAALAARGLSRDDVGGDLVVRNGTVDLFGQGADFEETLDFVRGLRPDVVFVDTLNLSAGAADQNSASDMSRISRALRRIGQAAEEKAENGERCTVVLIAHTTKADTDARGSSAIEDDADFVVHVKKAGERVTVTVAKQKDGPSGEVVELALKPFGDSVALVAGESGTSGRPGADRERVACLMAKIRDELIRHPGLTTNAITSSIPGRRTDITDALGRLIDLGHVRVEAGPRKSAHHHLEPTKPFVIEPGLAELIP